MSFTVSIKRNSSHYAISNPITISRTNFHFPRISVHPSFGPKWAYFLTIRIHQLNRIIRAIHIRAQRRVFVTHRVNTQPNGEVGGVIP